MAGTLTIDNRQWIERYQEIPFQTAITASLEIQRDKRVALPGIAPFLLKALKMQTLVTATGAAATRIFKWKFGNTDGGIWYSQAGIGGTNDRIISSLIFGTGQFPKVLTPPILYQANASIPMEFEAMTADADYTIYLSFEGSLLFPAPMQ